MRSHASLDAQLQPVPQAAPLTPGSLHIYDLCNPISLFLSRNINLAGLVYNSEKMSYLRDIIEFRT